MHTLTRRTLLAAPLLAAPLLATARPAGAAEPASSAPAAWAKEVPLIRVGLLGGENDADRLKRYGPYAELLQRSFGVPTRTFSAADYAGVVQAFAAGQLELAYMSPAAYAAAFVASNGNVRPLVTAQEKDGSTSYVSVMYVRADEPIHTLADMRGHSLAWADPNSASGYLIPRSEFREQAIDPATYFSRTGFAGGHEQAVIAVLNGQYDAGVTWTSGVGDAATGYTRGNLRTMVEKHMLDMDRLRIVWRSRPIENGPLTVRADTPKAFQDDMLAFHLGLASSAPAVFEAINMGSGPALVPVTAAAYQPFIDMLKAEATDRRRR